jgi:hypothetical protein
VSSQGLLRVDVVVVNRKVILSSTSYAIWPDLVPKKINFTPFDSRKMLANYAHCFRNSSTRPTKSKTTLGLVAGLQQSSKFPINPWQSSNLVFDRVSQIEVLKRVPRDGLPAAV